jgi:hypothetical protein
MKRGNINETVKSVTFYLAKSPGPPIRFHCICFLCGKFKESIKHIFIDYFSRYGIDRTSSSNFYGIKPLYVSSKQLLNLWLQ